MTTREDIAAWFDEGVQTGAKQMLVICDTFDWGDYPVYTHSEDECLRRYHNPSETQKVMEVYDLGADKATQLAMHRCMNVPRRAWGGKGLMADKELALRAANHAAADAVLAGATEKDLLLMVKGVMQAADAWGLAQNNLGAEG